MPARFHRVLGVSTLATLGVIACAPATASSVRESRYVSSAVPLTATSRVIDAERIQRSGSNTALDAIRALVPGYRAVETRPIGTGWVGTALTSRGSLRVLLDGHPIADVETLRTVRARDVVAIHVLSGPDASIRFGPSFNGGAIVIQTFGSLRPLE